jgi:hypothetical protein
MLTPMPGDRMASQSEAPGFDVVTGALEENQRVEFDISQGPKGPQAENVRPV